MTYNKFAHDAYIQSESWKCSKSPTGAHHWIGDQFVLQCKYCKETKKVEFPLGPMQEKVAELKRLRNAQSNTKLQPH